MKIIKLKDMVKGWFVGDFEPTAYKTTECEVGFKIYKAGEKEAKHVHRVGTELTLITSGKVRMNGEEYSEGDIIVMEPGEPTDFEAITDSTNVVVKVPSVKGDKYLS